MYHIFIVFILLIIFNALNKKSLIHVGVLMLAYMFSTRPMDIPDTEIYLRDFENPYEDFIAASLEPGFWSLNVLFGDILHISFSQFFFVITFFLMELWYYTTKKLLPYGKLGYCFLIFMSYNGFFYVGVTLRNAISLIISYYAVSLLLIEGKVKYVKYVCVIIVAFLFHRTALLFLILPLFLFFKLSSNLIRRWLVLDIIMLVLGGFISDLGSHYISSPAGGLDKYEETLTVEGSGSSLVSIWFIMNLMITFIIVKCRRYVDVEVIKLYDIFFIISMIGFSVNCIAWNLGIIQRLAGAFYFFNFIPLYLIAFHSDYLRFKKQKMLFANAVSIFCFIVLLYCQSFMIYY